VTFVVAILAATKSIARVLVSGGRKNSETANSKRF